MRRKGAIDKEIVDLKRVAELTFGTGHETTQIGTKKRSLTIINLKHSPKVYRITYQLTQTVKNPRIRTQINSPIIKTKNKKGTQRN